MRRLAEETAYLLDRLGRLPAWSVFAGGLAALVLAGRLFEGDARYVAAAVVIAAIALCAWAQPTGREDIVAAFMMPGFVSGIGKSLFGIAPALVGWPVAALALWGLACGDADEDGAPPEDPAAPVPAPATKSER